MRTTVTLDPDVEQALRQQIKERGVPFKVALNDAVRKGLLKGLRQTSARFTQQTFSMGAPQFRWEKSLSIADSLEDEEILRKMSIGK